VADQHTQIHLQQEEPRGVRPCPSNPRLFFCPNMHHPWDLSTFTAISHSDVSNHYSDVSPLLPLALLNSDYLRDGTSIHSLAIQRVPCHCCLLTSAVQPVQGPASSQPPLYMRAEDKEGNATCLSCQSEYFFPSQRTVGLCSPAGRQSPRSNSWASDPKMKLTEKHLCAARV
jgi:hypothetical protein